MTDDVHLLFVSAGDSEPRLVGVFASAELAVEAASAGGPLDTFEIVSEEVKTSIEGGNDG